MTKEHLKDGEKILKKQDEKLNCGDYVNYFDSFQSSARYTPYSTSSSPDSIAQITAHKIYTIHSEIID